MIKNFLLGVIILMKINKLSRLGSIKKYYFLPTCWSFYKLLIISQI